MHGSLVSSTFSAREKKWHEIGTLVHVFSEIRCYSPTVSHIDFDLFLPSSVNGFPFVFVRAFHMRIGVYWQVSWLRSH